MNRRASYNLSFEHDCAAGELKERIIKLEDSFERIQSLLSSLQVERLLQNLTDVESTRPGSCENESQGNSNTRRSSASKDHFPKSYLTDITQSISLPGFKFLGEKNPPRLQTILWVVIHLWALTASYCVIKIEFDRWKSSPIVRTLSNNLTWTRDIPFPATTICTPCSVDREDYLKALQRCFLCNSTEKSFECHYNKECTFKEKASLALASLSFTHANLSMTPCRICFSINGVRHKDIFRESTVVTWPVQEAFESRLDEGYIGNELNLDNMVYKGNISTVPIYIPEEGYTRTHVNTVDENTSTEVKSFKNRNLLFRITIHNPFDILFVRKHKIFMDKGFPKRIKVIPKLVTNEKGLEEYKPGERGCFYFHERELAMFKLYSETNCETECTANCSLLNCGCIPYYLPRHNSSVDVCLTKCKFENCDCGCLPDCNSLSYDYEEFPLKDAIGTNTEYMWFMEFKETHFYSTVRVSVNSFAQFVAYSLGVVGVFNGFSVMVVFEISYFLTFRLWHSVKAYLHGID
ncbi:pickpocket protein 28-like [Macrosteles quadrilineatus]|uniref:pickpocket protein 28-like n=1 Tax=Macrosteles quadrilineatus TaxID=74068 RepID=UPI0023E297E4|nr:pickpocket protein 28-like [Macrosteles quadrilineatus]